MLKLSMTRRAGHSPISLRVPTSIRPAAGEGNENYAHVQLMLVRHLDGWRYLLG
jgi:hypothetical protein